MTQDEINFNAMLCLDTLHCEGCRADIDFYIEDRKPFCRFCEKEIILTHEDLQKFGSLDNRAPIKRFSGDIAP